MLRTEALRVFVTVAECGNIRDAAERLLRTQSAISMTLKQVEDHLGAPLFENDRKSSLTQLGQFVRGVATVLLRDHDAAISLIEGHASGQSGHLRIASVPSVAALLIPELLRGFLAARPLAKVDLIDTDSADVRHLVRTGQADIGIASAPDADEGLTFAPLFEDQMKLVCQSDAALTLSRAPLNWSDLQGTSLILNETTNRIAASEFRALAVRSTLRVRNVTSLLAMVQAGVGVTLLPGLATVSLPPALMALPLADTNCTRQVGLLLRNGRVQSPIAAEFRQHLDRSIGALIARFGLLPVAAP
jgi:DNA-binding transcriptional LysR family regulator